MRKTCVIVLFLLLLSLYQPCTVAGQEGKDPAGALVLQAQQAREKLYLEKAIKLLDEARKIYRAQNNLKEFDRLTTDINEMTKVFMEYSLTEEELFKSLEKSRLPISREELKKLIADNALENMVIDGKKRYFTSCLSNVINRAEPSRKRSYRKMKEVYSRILGDYDWLIYNRYSDPFYAPYKPYHSPHVFLAGAELKIKKELLPRKGTLKIWIPFPINTSSQCNIKLLEVEPAEYVRGLPEVDADIGCLYMELPLPLKKDTIKVEYLFTQNTVMFAIDPARVGSYNTSSDLYRHFTRSDDNVAVTPEIRELADTVTGGEKNPYLAAKKIYDYVVYNVKYSFMPHLTLGVLGIPESEYVRKNHYGDCGGQAMFFSALCRAQGIPARCLGGMQLAPSAQSCHFWGQVYIPDYGWIPVDPSIAQLVFIDERRTEAEKKKFTDFFFGNMDPYRLYFQNETDVALYPVKDVPRLAGLAFQMPEARCEGCEIDPSLLITYELEVKRIQ